MNRRAFLLGATLLAACKKKEPAATRVATKTSHGAVSFLELTPPEPDPTLPLVVAVHANEGSPESWVEGFSRFPGRATILLPRAFLTLRDGAFSWFQWPLTNDIASNKLAMDVSSVEERLAAGIAARSGGKRVAVCGYTEGAMLALVLARRTDLVLGAYGIAAACPVPLFPKKPAAPIVAYHGTKDDVLALNAARETVKAFKAAGGEATLREYEGAGHSPTDQMHADLDADIVRALEAARSPR